MSSKILLIHNAAFRLRTRGFWSTGAMRYGLEIQAFAARNCWEVACRDTVLIGNLPTSLRPLSCHAFRPRVWSTACCGPGTSLRGITAGRGREGLGKKNQSLNVSYALDSSHTLLPRTSRRCTGWTSVERVQSRRAVHPSPGTPLWCAPLLAPQACAVILTAQPLKQSGVSRYELDDAPLAIGQPCRVTLAQLVHLRARQPSDHFGFARA